MFRFLTRTLWLGRIPKGISREEVFILTKGTKVRAYVYTSQSSVASPVILFFHGGGWVVGDIDGYDPLCRDLCDKTGLVVVSVNYRLAPEHPFPAGQGDCFDALTWVVENDGLFDGAARKVIIAGDSAGGNLAAVTVLQAANQFKQNIIGQILLYPAIEHYSANHHSYEDKARGYGLTKNLMIWFWDMYIGDPKSKGANHKNNSLVSPRCNSDLKNAPPTLLLTAEHDVLRDEGEEYAKLLKGKGVDVQSTMYKDKIHGFIGSMGPNKGHKKAMSEIAFWINNL